MSFASATRVANGGHPVPEDVIRRRVAASQDNLPAAIAIADHVKVHDNSGPAPRHVLTVAHGTIVFEAASLPGWLRSRMPEIRDIHRNR